MQRDERNKSAFHGNNGTYPFAIKPRYCNFLLGSSTKALATRFPTPPGFFPPSPVPCNTVSRDARPCTLIKIVFELF